MTADTERRSTSPPFIDDSHMTEFKPPKTINLTINESYGSEDEPKEIHLGYEPYHKLGAQSLLVIPGINYKLNQDNVTYYGTPTEIGTWTLILGYYNRLGHEDEEWRITFQVNEPAISIEGTPSLPKCLYVGHAIDPVHFKAQGGTPPYTYKIWHEGPYRAPKSLQIDATTGVLSGIPSETGSYTFWVGATDHRGYGGHNVGNNGWQKLTIEVRKPIMIRPSSLPRAAVGVYYSEDVHATDDVGGFTYNLHIPQNIGLAIDKHSGKISGTPTRTWKGTAALSATDKDGFGGQFTDINFKSPLDLNNPGASIQPKYENDGWSIYDFQIEEHIAIKTASLPDGKVGEGYPGSLIEATGGTGKYVYKSYRDVTDLPDGLRIETNGLVTGRPTRAGNFSFYLGATDSKGQGGHEHGMNGWRRYTIHIAPETVIHIPTNLSIDLQGRLDAQVGEKYDATLNVSGGTSPYKVEVFGLPMGLHHAGTKIEGKPKESGHFTFSVHATDAEGDKGIKSFALVVKPAHAVALALADVRGKFYSNDDGTQTLHISGKISGEGLGQNKPPSSVVFSLTTPTQRTPTTLANSKVQWSKEWEADGWAFSLTGIPGDYGDSLPSFEIVASLDNTTSKAARVLFPLKALLHAREFCNKHGDYIDGLLIQRAASARLHLGFRHAIDKLDILIHLPDHIRAGEQSTPPDPIHLNRGWDGHDTQAIFSLGENGLIRVPKGKSEAVLDLPVAIIADDEFTSGTLHAFIHCDSEIVVPSERIVQLTLTLQKA